MQIDCSDCYLPHLTEFVLRLSHNGNDYSGNIDVPTAGVNVDLAGQYDGHEIVMSGTRADTNTVSGADVNNLRVSTNSATGLAGTLSIGVHRFPAGEATFLSAVPAGPAAAPPPFEGRWTGRAIVTSCAGSCPAYMNTGASMRLSLALSQSGGSVNGVATFDFGVCLFCEVSLTGAVSGNAGDLRGEAKTIPQPRDDRYLKVLSFAATTDDVGQMRGHFHLFGESAFYQPDATRPFKVYDLEGDITYVLRQL